MNCNKCNIAFVGNDRIIKEQLGSETFFYHKECYEKTYCEKCRDKEAIIERTYYGDVHFKHSPSGDTTEKEPNRVVWLCKECNEIEKRKLEREQKEIEEKNRLKREVREKDYSGLEGGRR